MGKVHGSATDADVVAADAYEKLREQERLDGASGPGMRMFYKLRRFVRGLPLEEQIMRNRNLERPHNGGRIPSRDIADLFRGRK